MELLLQIGGTPGHGNGQFNEPTGIVVDSSGNVFVASIEPELDITGPENPERDDRESPEPS